MFVFTIKCSHSPEKEKAHTTTTERESLGELFWPKNFPGRRWIQKPYKNQESHIHQRNLSSVAPFFSAKKSSALEQGGVCFLFPRVWKNNPKSSGTSGWKMEHLFSVNGLFRASPIPCLRGVWVVGVGAFVMIDHR